MFYIIIQQGRAINRCGLEPGPGKRRRGDCSRDFGAPRLFSRSSILLDHCRASTPTAKPIYHIDNDVVSALDPEPPRHLGGHWGAIVPNKRGGGQWPKPQTALMPTYAHQFNSSSAYTTSAPLLAIREFTPSQRDIICSAFLRRQDDREPSFLRFCLLTLMSLVMT